MLLNYYSRPRARIVDSDNEESDQSEDSDNSDNSNSGDENSLVNSDDESPHPNHSHSNNGSAAKKGRDRTSRNSLGSEPERKSNRPRKAVGGYFDNESDEEDNGPDTPSAAPATTASTSNKRSREGSSGTELYPSSTNKRIARELSAEEYSNQYRRALPAKLAEYDERISTLSLSASSPDGQPATVCYHRILRALLSDERTEPFWEPVDVKLVPSYTHYIKQPMDLGTVRNKVEKGLYASPEAFKKVRAFIYVLCCCLY